ncbi:hypothetical protein HAV22_19210 [Massilia sp. TW-1]|uniref:Uncharacterized protein n=1 Tax=Telluria antibiotica TaxID=2717319 RepID=A0ABX0PF77_9BURK|nr:hypothetical protein [Telluria antibiotica]NIA55767.1 hypothetical protein [Telluria antibiotica]
MKKFLSHLVLLVAGLFFSQQAAAVYECNVKVINVLVYADGSLNVLHSGRGDYTVVCNLNTERQGVSPTTCAVWFGLLEAIKKKNGVADIYFNGDGSCSTLPTYGSAPAPVYIGDVTQ